MASKIGLKEAEYQCLTNSLPQIHQENIEQIEKVLTKIEELNQQGGGFYLDDITPKVNLLITELRNIKSSMISVYETHEEIVESFIRAVDNYDTLC